VAAVSEIERLARVLCAAQEWPWVDQEAADRAGNFSGADYCEHVRAILQAMREPSEPMVRAGWSAFERLPIVPQNIWTGIVDSMLAEPGNHGPADAPS
jgi:hypothetical protein